MSLRLHQSSMLALAVFCCSVTCSVALDTDDPFACYHGSIEMNKRGQVPFGSKEQLTAVPCGHPVPPTSTATPPQLPATSVTTSDPMTSPTLTTPAGDSRGRRDSPTPFVCAVSKTFPGGPKLSLNTTWTANFSCLPEGECSKNMFCCGSTKCNSLTKFMLQRGIKYESVDSCLVGSKTSNASNVRVLKCPGSHFCYKSTGNGVTKFGCSMESTCSNVTGQEVSRCATTGDTSTLCCCASDNCNGPLPFQPTYPTRIVTTTAPPYLVTASQTSSHWMLVLLIAAGIVIGALVGVIIVALCKRRKRKRMNGPLNISYSRVSADFTVEDDDNIFSY